MVKKGDTLIEVTIAIGIFSMIAIGVASVMSSGSSGSQTALETTLAREEIDVQAEALRFIHSARISSRSDSDNPYDTIWNAITASAIDGGTMDASTAQFNPSSCQALYNRDNDNSVFAQHAFILNPRALDSSQNGLFRASEASDASVFTPTTTHPRLVFDASGNNLRAEGIYVIAVKDAGTNIVGYDGAEPAFYDFYIRTCWYGSDNERPSTISTVIRLYSPPAVASKPSSPGNGQMLIVKYTSGEKEINNFNVESQYLSSGDTATVRPITAYPIRFQYWNDTENHINRYVDGENSTFTYESNGQPDDVTWIFKAVWDMTSNDITYNANGGKFSGNKTETIKHCDVFAACDKQDVEGFTFTIDSSLTPTRDGYDFLGWADSTTATSPTRTSGTTYEVSGRSVTLYAVWRPRYIQDFSFETCKKKANGNDYTVVDRRDNRVYRVRYDKLRNKCWMVDDLRIGSTTGGVVTPSGSNFTKNGNLVIASSTARSYTAPIFENYTSSTWYNFCAATAGTGNGCTKNSQYFGNQDICPTNWRMPTATEALNSSTSTSNIFRSSDTGYWWTSTDEIGLGIDDSGRLMCLLCKYGNGFSFSDEFYKSSCKQYTPGTYTMSGYLRDNVIKIRCIHK